VAVVDLDLRSSCGIDFIRQSRLRRADGHFVAVTHHGSEEKVHAAVAAGAQGYVLKSDGAGEILRAIRAVHTGRRYLTPGAAAQLAGHVSRDTLTPREQEIVALLARGFRNKRIAAMLSLAEQTVKGHVSRILVKLGADSRVGAVAEAIRRGFVHFD
jgi:two-component system NarL family response regulator